VTTCFILQTRGREPFSSSPDARDGIPEPMTFPFAPTTPAMDGLRRAAPGPPASSAPEWRTPRLVSGTMARERGRKEHHAPKRRAPSPPLSSRYPSPIPLIPTPANSAFHPLLPPSLPPSLHLYPPSRPNLFPKSLRDLRSS
jgi:hypothetical protein